MRGKFMKKTKPKIYKYNDIIIFLNDLFVFLKTKDKKSLRDIAKELKVASGLLPMVLNRKRNLTETVLKSILKRYKYNKKEIEFAVNLRTIGYSSKFEEKKSSINKINKLKNYRDFNQKEFELYKYLSEWYFVAIKEMTELQDFQEDVEWIQKRLAYNLNQKEIEKALKFLKKQNILVYKNNKLTAAQKDMQCEEGIYKLSLGGFHKQILNLAANAIDSIDRDKRRLLGHTLKINNKQIDQVHGILNEAFEKLKKISSTSELDEDVYHIELISIPITKKVKS